MATETALTIAKPAEQQAQQLVGPSVYAPRNFAEAMRLAELIAKSALAPKDYRGRVADVFVAMAYGAELGLHPFQAVQDIKVINGRASIWGDAALALVKRHPDCIKVVEPKVDDAEMIGRCIVYRRNAEPHEQEFTVDDAKTAGLWGKPGPWTQYPKRMLKMRARGFALRDTFPDALRGFHLVEETQDYVDVVDATPVNAPPAVLAQPTLDDDDRAELMATIEACADKAQLRAIYAHQHDVEVRAACQRRAAELDASDAVLSNGTIPFGFKARNGNGNGNAPEVETAQ